MATSKSIFAKCSCCGCSVLEINYDDFEKANGQFNVAMWSQHSGDQVMSKKERIRWCKHIMKTGKPWADHTIVSTQDAQRIAKFLTKKITQYGKKKSSRK